MQFNWTNKFEVEVTTLCLEEYSLKFDVSANVAMLFLQSTARTVLLTSHELRIPPRDFLRNQI